MCSFFYAGLKLSYQIWNFSDKSSTKCLFYFLVHVLNYFGCMLQVQTACYMEAWGWLAVCFVLVQNNLLFSACWLSADYLTNLLGDIPLCETMSWSKLSILLYSCLVIRSAATPRACLEHHFVLWSTTVQNWDTRILFGTLFCTLVNNLELAYSCRCSKILFSDHMLPFFLVWIYAEAVWKC